MSLAKSTKKLLAWYDTHARELPWRAPIGVTPNTYHVWLSEIMLQQTTVVAVIPYFNNFIRVWPSVTALANAKDDDVMRAWAGLGYYARARNMLKCARHIRDNFNGIFPKTEKELIALPGIGPYTAAAICAIAFDQKAAPIDGNIERVISRLTACTTPLPALKVDVAKSLESLVPNNRAGDFAQAMMDLGATICTPKNPNCGICPWNKICAAYAQNIADTFPRRRPKKPKTKRTGVLFWVYNEHGHILTRQRPARGLLGNMIEFPSHGWDTPNDRDIDNHLSLNWVKHSNAVRHVFTHFELTLSVWIGHATPSDMALIDNIDSTFTWRDAKALHAAALPNLMRKAEVFVEKTIQSDTRVNS